MFQGNVQSSLSDVADKIAEKFSENDLLPGQYSVSNCWTTAETTCLTSLLFLYDRSISLTASQTTASSFLGTYIRRFIVFYSSDVSTGSLLLISGTINLSTILWLTVHVIYP